MAKPFVKGPADFRPPPYKFEDITSITFRLPSNNPAKLQGICDAFLNVPLGRPLAKRFEPFNDSVLLTFARFPDAESDAPLPIGSVSYQEVSLVFAVWDKKHDGAAWYAALLFLDGPQEGDAEFFATPRFCSAASSSVYRNCAAISISSSRL